MQRQANSLAWWWVGIVALPLLWGCDQEVAQYQSSWLHQAHQLQRDLDQDQPLRRATFIGTHNSYNAAAYTTPQSYYDPNQIHTITNQLQMDVRALELDVHSFFGYDLESGTFYRDVLLCHGTDQHIGCSPFDRPLVSALEEIIVWLQQPQNQDEVLLIYIEDHTSADDNFILAETLLGVLGEYLYLPQEPGCNLIAPGLSKAAVRAADKNVLLISDHCSGESVSYALFGGFADSIDSTGYPTVGLASLQAAPRCLDTELDQQAVQQNFIRMQEDRTLLSRAVGNGGIKITPASVSNLLACEINLLGLDKLQPGDGRLQAALWSWAEGHPTGGELALCAQHNANGRFESADCGSALPYSCRDSASGQWVVTTVQGNWDQGEASCAALGMHFEVPFSAYENAQLQAVKQASGVLHSWLDYHGSQSLAGFNK